MKKPISFSKISTASHMALGLCALGLCLATPRPAFADADQAQWRDMIQVCESVIQEQDRTALIPFAPAPGTYGKPGEKGYAIYSETQDLTVLATVLDDTDWTECVVQETVENDRKRWRGIAEEWQDSFSTHFPTPDYIPVETRYNPNAPFQSALRCMDDGEDVLIQPSLQANFHFRVYVSNAPGESAQDICSAAN